MMGLYPLGKGLKKVVAVVVFFVVVCVILASWLVLELPKVFKGDAKSATKMNEIDSNIASANDMAMDIIISDLKDIERIFSNDKAIAKEAKKLRTEAEALWEDIKKIQTDEQRLMASEKVKKFSMYHERFIVRCIEEMKKDRNEKPIRAEIKGVKEI